MVYQAAGFAVLAAISPTALLVMAVFLSSSHPREAAVAYVAGATAMTVLMAVAVLFLIRGAGLNQPREQDPLYGLRLALGVLALVGAAVIAHRRRSAPRRADAAPPPEEPPDQPRAGLVSRFTARPQPRTAFVAGVIIFVPGATFIAAVQVVAAANASVGLTVLTLLLVVILSLLVVWLPLVGYLAAPQATTRRLNAVNAWLRVNGGLMIMTGLAVCGIALTINGGLGLANG